MPKGRLRSIGAVLFREPELDQVVDMQPRTITVTVDSTDGTGKEVVFPGLGIDLVKRESFRGRWLIGDRRNGIKGAFLRPGLDTEGSLRESDDGVIWSNCEFSVGQTIEGHLKVYERDDGVRSLRTYANFIEMSSATDSRKLPQYPRNVIAAVALVLGVPLPNSLRDFDAPILESGRKPQTRRNGAKDHGPM